MSNSSFIAQLAVYQTCRDIEAQIKLYTEYGFVEDAGYTATSDIPAEYYESRGISAPDIVKSTALKLPEDPYMHLVLTQFHKPKTGPSWPAPYDQLGSRAHSFLVKSVDKELSRIQTEFPKIKILHGALTVNRKWGKMRSALMLDPQGVYFEIAEIEPTGSFFTQAGRRPSPDGKSWLHFMINCDDITEQLPFYKSFGLVHDSRVDFRADGFFPYGMEKFAREHKESMGMNMGDTGSSTCDFLHSIDDVSNMHFELLGYKPGTLQEPGASPTWPQKGIARYCFKTGNKEQDLERARQHGHHIFIPDNKICVGWGDTEYYYFGDTDGNLLTSEQWHHHGYFGSKM